MSDDEHIFYFFTDTEVDEQKIGMAVEPIPGKMAFFGDNGSNKMHIRWERAQHVKSSVGNCCRKSALIPNLVEQCDELSNY